MRVRRSITVDSLADAELTYPDVGATARENLPAGYHHVHHVARLGTGPETFERAARALTGWRMHEGAGLRVAASHPDAVPGTITVMGLGVGPFRMPVPCRVVYRVDEPTRRGFAYGTLPGHPASGEEAFIVHLTDGGDVELVIRAFSRPATRLAKAGGPVTGLLQRVVTARYGRSLRRLAAAD